MYRQAQALLRDMKVEQEGLPLGEEASFVSKYGPRIKDVGEVNLLVTMFRDLQDSELTAWMLRLAFVWRGAALEDWRYVLRQISREQPAVYQFTNFAGRILALDVGRLIRSDPQIPDVTYRYFADAYPEGAPIPDDWDKERLEEEGVDWQAMWRRLATEGAPMSIRLE